MQFTRRKYKRIQELKSLDPNVFNGIDNRSQQNAQQIPLYTISAKKYFKSFKQNIKNLPRDKNSVNNGSYDPTVRKFNSIQSNGNFIPEADVNSHRTLNIRNQPQRISKRKRSKSRKNNIKINSRQNKRIKKHKNYPDTNNYKSQCSSNVQDMEIE